MSDSKSPGPSPGDEGLARELGAIGIALLALNGMIGAGIFGVPAGAAALTGAWSPLVFVACAAWLALIMLCFAEIASRFERTGGPIAYLDAAWGRFAGFQAGWAFWVARVTAFAANLNLLVDSVAWFVPAAGQGTTRVALLTLIVVLLAWINFVGVRSAIRSLGVLTLLKLLPLLVLVIAGLGWLAPAAQSVFTTPAPDTAAFATAALLVVYAFVGWESALVPAGEVRDPARAMPRALFGALAVATVFYVLIQTVSVAALPELAASERALVDVGQALLGPAGALLLTIGVVVSVGGNLTGSMLSSPRLTYALARDGSFPEWFGRLHPRHRTPVNSIAFAAVVIVALSVFGSFLWLAAASALVRVLIYMGCIAAMPRLRRRLPERGFTLPGGWALPALAFALSAVLLLEIELDSLLATLAVLAAGALIYALSRRG